MKRKLLEQKSVKTLKSLHKNIIQKYNGVVKSIERKEKELHKIVEDTERIEDIIVEKESK